MTIVLTSLLLSTIQEHGERCYPEEGAGVILGTTELESRTATDIIPIVNSSDSSERHHRYLIAPREMLTAEIKAEELNREVIGIFHSHPDHPAEPSEVDKQWALPWYSYIITAVEDGEGKVSRAWLFAEDRTRFHEEEITILETSGNKESK
jgi:proteasome lid subunit RPN8/RPN11